MALTRIFASPAHTDAGIGAPTSHTRSAEAAMLDMDAEMAGLTPAEDREPAVHAMLSLDQEMAGLVPEADNDVSQAPGLAIASATLGDSLQESGHPQHVLVAPAMAHDAQPVHVIADVDSTVAELAAPAQSQPPATVPVRITEDVDQMLEDLSSSAVTYAEEAHMPAEAASGSAQRSHVTADVDDVLADLSTSAVSQADAESAAALPVKTGGSEAVVAANESETVLDESYQDDAFEETDSVLPSEAAATAASLDVPLDSISEVDAVAGKMDHAPTEEAAVVMPERPAGPVAMQLTAAAASAEPAVDMLHDTSAPASLAGDPSRAEDLDNNDTYDDDVFEPATDAQTDAKSEDGLVVSAGQAAQEEEVRSQAGSNASSDLDAVTDDHALPGDSAQTAGQHDDESYENDAFDMEAEQSEQQAEDSEDVIPSEQSMPAEPLVSQVSEAHESAARDAAAYDQAAGYSAIHESVAQRSEEGVLAAQGSAADAAAPKPPPQRPPMDARRPARPSRAFIRHAISLTQGDGEDSSRAGQLPAAPLPAAPQAPAGPPPRHRWGPSACEGIAGYFCLLHHVHTASV